MTRKFSEGEIRRALVDMDLETMIFKPADMPGPSQNQKPADYIVWWREDRIDSWPITNSSRAALVEVKSTTQKRWWSFRDPAQLRPSQVLAMRDAQRIGLPYFVAIHLAAHRRWGITDGDRVLARLDRDDANYPFAEFPISCAPHELASHLRMALVGEISL